MAQYNQDAFKVFEEVYLKLLDKPTMDMSPEEKASRAETMHEVSIKIMQMETANMQELVAAYDAEGEKMERALETLEQATTANDDYMTMLQGVDQALQLVSNFFLFLL